MAAVTRQWSEGQAESGNARPNKPWYSWIGGYTIITFRLLPILSCNPLLPLKLPPLAASPLPLLLYVKSGGRPLSKDGSTLSKEPLDSNTNPSRTAR